MQTYTAQQLLSPDNTNVLEEVILVLAHSFIEDPHTKWLFFNHTRSQYIAALPSYFRVVVKVALLSDASVTVVRDDPLTPPKSSSIQTQKQDLAGARIKAVGIIIPPHGNKTFDSPLTGVRASALTLPFTCGLVTTWRLLVHFVPALKAMQDRIYPPTDLSSSSQEHFFWHIMFLATHPDAQGQGLGTKLLREYQKVVTQVVETSDKQEGEAASLYLEASSVSSKRLYSRVGFRDRDTMVYGTLGEGDDVRVDEEGRVIGGRQFGMTWTP
ncbi:hypothetical protein H2198_000596 [Neophaeococcomyces mojaviensis]|uniref:Uncharacterized protein n=1 Tax=Neophaeococcomyces mojaviensis TaxID=3383035 RepID=A0ACC3AJU8_9EURO|nr:hypothetical protein H2198_000596 [Knufia sp. JES_112]